MTPTSISCMVLENGNILTQSLSDSATGSSSSSSHHHTHSPASASAVCSNNYINSHDSRSSNNGDDSSESATQPRSKRMMKRKRAAHLTHKLSEKRRRDDNKVNKRLRALQHLIPNCTKVDKASVLDETIEYLKSLQLRVQIMSSFGVPHTQIMFPAYSYPAIAIGSGAVGCTPPLLFASLFVGYDAWNHPSFH